MLVTQIIGHVVFNISLILAIIAILFCFFEKYRGNILWIMIEKFLV